MSRRDCTALALMLGVLLPALATARLLFAGQRTSTTSRSGQAETRSGDLSLAERSKFYRQLANTQQELESSHRARAKEWLSKLSGPTRPDAGKAETSGSWTAYVKAQAAREDAAAKHHSAMMYQYMHMTLHPEEELPADLPPLPTAHGQERDRKVFEAVLKDAIATFKAGGLDAKIAQGIALHCNTLCDTMPDAFLGLLSNAGLARAVAGDLEADLGRRNSGGPVNMDYMKFSDDRITVRDLHAFDINVRGRPDELTGFEFREQYPAVKAYVKAYLPGYTKDGKTAAVRMFLGPPADPHGLARYSGVVTEEQGKWTVRWRFIDHPE